MRTALYLAKEVGEELGRSEVLQRTMQKVERKNLDAPLIQLIKLLPTVLHAAQLGVG
jgi:hypothetical protein